MNKKTILSLTTALLLATSAMAYDGHKGNKHQGNKNSCKMKNKHGDSQMFVKMIMKLDLTEKQRSEIVSIVKQSRQNMPNPSKAFSESSFDKKEFIKLANEKRDAKLEHRADMIEKIYKVLNSTQKKDLRTMLDMRDIMKKSMNKNMNKNRGENCNAKNCNGRRQ